MMDGKTHRVPAQGDGKGEAAGFYVAFTDGHPAGYIKNNRSGLDMRWKSTGYTLSEEEKARLNAEAATKREERERERAATYDATAERVQQRAAQCRQIEQATPYMERKGIAPTIGALASASDNTIHLPAIDTIYSGRRHEAFCEGEPQGKLFPCGQRGRDAAGRTSRARQGPAHYDWRRLRDDGDRL